MVEAKVGDRELESLRGHGGYLRVFHAFNPRTLLCRLLEISSAPIAYLTIFVKYLVLWIYEIYVDLLVQGINRVGRYFRSKYILTDVIEKRNAVKRSITFQ